MNSYFRNEKISETRVLTKMFLINPNKSWSRLNVEQTYLIWQTLKRLGIIIWQLSSQKIKWISDLYIVALFLKYLYNKNINYIFTLTHSFRTQILTHTHRAKGSSRFFGNEFGHPSGSTSLASETTTGRIHTNFKFILIIYSNKCLMITVFLYIILF